MYKWNPASGILNELSDCILYRQTNGTLWINFSMFFGKLALKKHFFEVHTPKFADPPPIVHNCCELFFLFFFGGFPNTQCSVLGKYLERQKFKFYTHGSYILIMKHSDIYYDSFVSKI